MAAVIDAEPLGQLDYAEVVDATSLSVPEPLAGTLRLLAAVRFGKARLIDNVAAEVPAEIPSAGAKAARSEEHTSELQSLMRISYAVFCLKKKKQINKQ